jgi:hypothetical protein
MRPAGPWEAFVAEHFPAYLLPNAARRALSVEAAARFLERTTGDRGRLFLLRAASAIAARESELCELAQEELPRIARALPPRIEAPLRLWEGPARGRIDVPATVKQRLLGRALHTATRAPERRLDRPENILVKAAAKRLLEVLSALRASGALAEGGGWGEGFGASAEAIHRALTTTPLVEVPDAPVTLFHEQAALGARGRGYALAASLHRALREGLDEDRPDAIARAVAAGALLPLDAAVRFELAVVIRLIQAISERVLELSPPERWTLHRTVLLPDRPDIAHFERNDGAHVRIFYNQSVLGPGPFDACVRHYLGRDARLRPDVTILIEPKGAGPRAAVVEAKLSSDPDYIAQGYRQALVYHHEYASRLAGWPKAILVASSHVPGAPRREDDVIAVSWDRWVPDVVLDGLLDGLA